MSVNTVTQPVSKAPLTFRLKYLSLLEDLLHGHARNDHSCFTFDDSSNNILYMVLLCFAVKILLLGRIGLVCAARKKQRIFSECALLVVGADGKHCWQRKLQLLDCHSLKAKREIIRCYRYPRTLFNNVSAILLTPLERFIPVEVATQMPSCILWCRQSRLQWARDTRLVEKSRTYSNAFIRDRLGLAVALRLTTWLRFVEAWWYYRSMKDCSEWYCRFFLLE